MKELTLEDLSAKLVKAKASYAKCGCKIYKEEAAALSARIKEIETGLKAF